MKGSSSHTSYLLLPQLIKNAQIRLQKYAQTEAEATQTVIPIGSDKQVSEKLRDEDKGETLLLEGTPEATPESQKQVVTEAAPFPEGKLTDRCSLFSQLRRLPTPDQIGRAHV